MDSILPPDHILNSNGLRYFMYTTVYGIFNIIPAPVIYAAVAYENQYELKLELMQSVQVYFEDFLSDCVLATRVDGSNPISIAFACGISVICSFGAATVLVCSHVIWRLTSKVGIIGSARYKAQQRQLFLSLVFMVKNLKTSRTFV